MHRNQMECGAAPPAAAPIGYIAAKTAVRLAPGSGAAVAALGPAGVFIPQEGRHPHRDGIGSPAQRWRGPLSDEGREPTSSHPDGRTERLREVRGIGERGRECGRAGAAAGTTLAAPAPSSRYRKLGPNP